ncbi:MAG: hypothetical protein KAX30_04250 [Candidatus Atribacteria bacterium]|nr:hypothetical protein [Candidatus Atribacteria bacterium]
MKKKVTKKTETKETKIKTQPKNLTAEEAAIFQRIKSEDREWETISEDETLDYSLADDPFKFPKVAIELMDAKKLAFRWITRKNERIDEIRNLPVPRRWWIVNTSTVPELANDVDPVLGCITLLDQLLVFKPYWMYKAENKMKAEMADTKDKAGDLKSKDKMSIDESGSEFLAGKQHKIGKGDEVQFHETTQENEEGEPVFEHGDDSLGEIVEE